MSLAFFAAAAAAQAYQLRRRRISGPSHTLSAWRPLKDAPTNLPAYVEDGNGAHVATWDDEWGYWLGERLCILSEETLSLPIADTYELDRAVQVGVAVAFANFFSMASAGRPVPSRWAIKDLGEALHTAMGGRIPDEVP